MEREEQLELLNSFADGELDEHDRELVERLLKEDPNAAFDSTQIVNMKKLVRRWEGVKGSDEFRERILASVSSQKPEGGRSALLGWLLGVVAALLLVAGGYLLFQRLGGIDLLIEWFTPEASSPTNQPDSRADPTRLAPVPPKPLDAHGHWARVTALDGAVSIKTENEAQPEFRPARSGDLLRPGQALTTDETAWAELALADGSRLRVQSARVSFPATGTELQLESGVLLAHIPRTAPELPVNCGGHRIVIHPDTLGLIATDAAGTVRVALRRGNVSVQPRGASAKPRKVAAGETLTIRPDGTVGDPTRYHDKGEFGDFGGE